VTEKLEIDIIGHDKISGVLSKIRVGLGGFGNLAVKALDVGLAAAAGIAGMAVTGLGAAFKIAMDEATEAQDGIAAFNAVLTGAWLELQLTRRLNWRAA
jgi:urea transporter